MDQRKGDSVMMIENIPFQMFDIESRWLFSEETRLNASSYSTGSIRAYNMIDKLKKSDFDINNLDNFSNSIFVGARSKRLFTTKKDGISYLMPIDLFTFNLKPRKWVRRETEDLENWWVSKNTILVTQSGTPGRTLITNKLFEEKVVSPNVIRYVPNKAGKEKLGYIYAYLSSWIGQALLTKDQYGETVKHIEPHHIANIPIPRIPDLEEKINQKILEAYRMREEAQELLLKAEEMIYLELGLPKIDEDDVEYFGGEKGKIVKSFEIKASELNLRLDASYCIPILKHIKKYLTEHEAYGKYNMNELRSVAEVFDLPTYKRIYVNPDEGLPILSGVHLGQIKLWDLKYISGLSFKSDKNLIDKYRIKKGWILTTERGTTGISSLVTEYQDGWLASHNIIRVVSTNINPGYLLAYLNTEYAQYQLKSKELGAVVEVLDPRDMGDIIIPIPEKDIQDHIGSIIIEAYDKRDKSNQIEEDAIKLLEGRLKEIAEG
jgi:type I restriction enzyme S subunit